MADRDEKIKELLYDINKAKGDYDEIETLLYAFGGSNPPGYKLLVEFSMTADESEDDVFSEEFEKKMTEKITELEDAGVEPDLMRIVFYKKD